MKLYVNEADSAGVRQLVRSAGELWSSMWCLAEVGCAFRRRLEEGSLTPAQAGAVRKKFLDSLDRGLWTLLPVTDDLLLKVEESVHRLPPGSFLRAGDAVHLVTAQQAGFGEIWSADRHLLLAAPRFGLAGRSV